MLLEDKLKASLSPARSPLWLTSCNLQTGSLSPDKRVQLFLQALAFDEDVAGLVEGLVSADDPKHEELHLIVRAQVCLRQLLKSD